MEMRASPLNDPQVIQPDAQVLEIIGRNALSSRNKPEEPEETDVWFLEMGDDSVFYSDEEQSYQDKEAIASCDFGSSRCKRLVNSVAHWDSNQQQADDAADERSSEMEKDVTKQIIWTEEFKKLQTPKTERVYATDDNAPAVEYDATLQSNCTTADMQTQQELNKSAKKVNQKVQEEVVLKDQISNKYPSDAFHDWRYARLNEEVETSDAVLQKSGDRQSEVALDVHAGFSQKPDPSDSTPLKRTGFSGFNHLTSSKYSTVSYRRIRRGNTQEKIHEFEVMLMN